MLILQSSDESLRFYAVGVAISGTVILRTLPLLGILKFYYA